MIDFKLRNKYYKADAFEESEKQRAKKFVEDIKLRSEKSNGDKYQLGCKLIDFYNTGSYASFSHDRNIESEYGSFRDRNGHSKVFFAVCEIHFGMDKSTVSRLMNVVDEFGSQKKRTEGLRKEYQAYSWSVLAEMLSMKKEHRDLVDSDMTVKQVRDLKKRIATSQQDDDEKLLEKLKEFDKFKKYTRRDLLIYINELEVAVKHMRELYRDSDMKDNSIWKEVFEDKILAEEREEK